MAVDCSFPSLFGTMQTHLLKLCEIRPLDYQAVVLFSKSTGRSSSTVETILSGFSSLLLCYQLT